MSEDERRDSFDATGLNEDGKTEAQVKMEAEAKRRSERDEAEWKEYEEMRKSEREREEQEIRELRERRERRKKERAEEERRLAEQRAVEEQKRRAEEEDRSRRRREEEAQRKAEREKKRLECEERSRNLSRPNFVINKKPGDELVPKHRDDSENKKPTKSKEQLESEKKATLEQRIQPINTSGMREDQLKEKAKDLNTLIYRLESEKYDLSQQFQRQNIDLMELAERVRQMTKGGQGKKVNMAQNDPRAAMGTAPPKIAMYSQYERVKDRRTFGDRQTVFTGPMYAHEWIKIEPSNIIEMGDQGAYIAGSSGKAINDQPLEIPVA